MLPEVRRDYPINTAGDYGDSGAATYTDRQYGRGEEMRQDAREAYQILKDRGSVKVVAESQ